MAAKLSRAGPRRAVIQVQRDGWYGTAPRRSQRYRCVSSALVTIANGGTYVEASRSVRASVGRLLEQAQQPLSWTDNGFRHGQLAATWVETYAEAALGGDEESSWPAVVLVDATNFWTYTGGRRTL